MVTPIEGMEYMWEMNGDDCQWRRADVNGGGLQELINLHSQNDGRIFMPIDRIFAYKEGRVEMVFSDLNDYTEYLFLGRNGNLIYDYTSFGQVEYGSYSQYRFDVKWDKKLLDKLEIYYFFDEEAYDEEEIDFYKEQYPDTYGRMGSGVYCFRSRMKTEEELKAFKEDEGQVLEAITEKEFMDAYRQMTGVDFLEANTDWQIILCP